MIEQLINPILNSVDISYLFAIIFFAELVKLIPNIKYEPKGRKYSIKIFKRKIYFRFRYVVAFLALLLGVFYFYCVPQDGSKKAELIRLVLTYCVTITLYDLLFRLIIVKFKELLKRIIGAKIRPIDIDISNGISNNITGFDSNPINGDGNQYNGDVQIFAKKAVQKENKPGENKSTENKQTTNETQKDKPTENKQNDTNNPTDEQELS